VFVVGGEFPQRLRKLGKQRGVEVHFDHEHGKGSHGRVYFGRQSTTVKVRKKEIGLGVLRRMLAHLGIDVRDL
jgi:hypothetical protein